MASLMGWLRAQGNAGAVANAKVLLDERRLEEWVARDLECRLEPLPDSRREVEAA